jgi:hypothetical protein
LKTKPVHGAPFKQFSSMRKIDSATINGIKTSRDFSSRDFSNLSFIAMRDSLFYFSAL